jgi:class 3 adenylate cyclase
MLIAEPLGELKLRGFSRPTAAYNVVGLDAAKAPA